MDFMRVLDQTVREIKREVNLKVLKVPEIEQKVLDATSDEPWGPHGSALSEIAQTTKKFTECQMIMNVLWTRLTETGANWRHVYKALAVIEYLVANGSERALDDILERSHRIASISDFQYVEPSGKDVGVNVRKKVETISALLSDKGKIQEIRNKAAANRDKYFGLSSTGVTYKSSSASHGGSSFQHNDRYGSLSGGKEDGSFKDSYSDREQYGGEIEQKHGKRENHNKSQETFAKEDGENRSKKGLRHHARNQDSSPTSSLKPVPKPSSAPSMNSGAQPNRSEDDFDDFDPRGSSTAGSASASFKQVDLFSQNLVGDLMDAPPPISMETTTSNNVKVPEVDLFADATFISASPHVETSSQTQGDIDLFASQPANPVAFSANTDFFAAPDQGLPPETKSLISEPTNTKVSDPFAAFPLNNFEESDLFGSFASHANPNTESSQNSTANINNSDQTSSSTSKPAAKDTFQVKSGIWADSLSRGLIDLNITAPKKTSLADIGIVGGLGDGLDEKEKGPSTSMYMGRAMGSGSGLGMSGFPSSTAMGGNGGFSTLGQQQFGRSK